jgi:hypothetical protein
MEDKGLDFLTAFLLPPLQIIAATLNFVILLFTGRHLFELPLRKLSDLQASAKLVEAVSKEKPSRSAKPSAKNRKAASTAKSRENAGRPDGTA